MEILNNLFSPTSLFFIVILIGCLLSKIKICHISFDLLIVAIFTGWFISKFCPTVMDEDFHQAMSLFSKAGTALFVSVIAISSGFCFEGRCIKKNLLHFILGALIVGIGFISAKTILWIDMDFDKSLLLGILCGALTSTPGLSSVCESQGIIAQNAILGYGAAYLFGVVGVVLFVQCFTQKTNVSKRIDRPDLTSTQDGIGGLIVIGVISVLGQYIGLIPSPLSNRSFGTTGGILICGIATGFILNQLPKLKRIVKQQFHVYRSFGLMMFFVGTGINAGQHLNMTLDTKWFLYGAIITMSCVIIGYIICKFITKEDIKTCLCVIAGGMTSTPALGTLIKNNHNNIDLSAYSLSYLGALSTIILGINAI